MSKLKPTEDLVIFFHEWGDEEKKLAFDILARKEIAEKVREVVLRVFGKDEDYEPRCDYVAEFLEETGAQEDYVLVYSGDLAHTPSFNAEEVTGLLFLVLRLVDAKIIRALEAFYGFKGWEESVGIDVRGMSLGEVDRKLKELEERVKKLENLAESFRKVWKV